MEVKQAVSLTINKDNVKFIEQKAKLEKRSKSEVINQILSAFQKHYLKKEISAGFNAQTKKDVESAISDFGDYLDLTESNI